jgi:hypothetical protein
MAQITMAAYDPVRDGTDPRKVAGILQGVEAELRAALGQSPEHLGARALLGRYLAATAQTASAIDLLAPLATAGQTLAADDLALASAYLAGNDREKARAALRLAAGKDGVDRVQLKALAERVDAALVVELGLRQEGSTRARRRRGRRGGSRSDRR